MPSRVMPALLTSTSTGPSSASTFRPAACAVLEDADVALDDHDAEFLGAGLGGFVVAGIAGRDLHAVGLQPFEIARPDAARAAGDECNSRHARLSLNVFMVPCSARPAATVEVLALLIGSDARRTWPRPCRRRCRGWPGPSWRCERFISCSRVVRIRAPEAPIGWPMAMAPPLTLTLAGSRPSSLLTTHSDWAAKASLDSTRVEVGDGPAGLLQRLAGGRDRAGAHDRRVDAGGGPGGDAGERLQAALLGFVGAHQHQGGGAVIEARGVGGGDRAFLVEGGRSLPCARAWRRGGCTRPVDDTCRPCGP
jgi:hypothetical protein